MHYILSKLKVISKLHSGQKLVVNDSHMEIYECDKNKWDRLVKWWIGETRAKTIDKLQGFFLEIQEVINVLLANPEKNMVTIKRLENELHAGVRGLNNLMLTYQDDPTSVAQLETLTENFNLQIKRLGKSLQNFDIDENSQNAFRF